MAEGSMTIGNVIFKTIVAFQSHNINFVGNITVQDTSESANTDTYLGVEATNIKIFEGASMLAGTTILHANDTIEMRDGSQILSTKSNTCVDDRNIPDLFACIHPTEKEAERIEYSAIMAKFREQFPTYLAGRTELTFPNWWGAIKSNYTVYMISSGQTKLDGATINAPRIGICAGDA